MPIYRDAFNPVYEFCKLQACLITGEDFWHNFDRFQTAVILETLTKNQVYVCFGPLHFWHQSST